MNRERLRANLESVRERIAGAAERAGRRASDVSMVAVTKRTPPDWANALLELGVCDLGENYPQELWSKAESLGAAPVRWHLIGHLQGNKAKRTLPLVKMVHAVDSLKLLRSLDDLVVNLADSPRICLQVNTSGEGAKHGWSPEAIGLDAEAIAGCRRIPVVGLMTMAALDSSPESARPSFARLREIRDDLRLRTGLPLQELSMGMSGDFEPAIEEGATWVRIGSALFEGVET